MTLFQIATLFVGVYVQSSAMPNTNNRFWKLEYGRFVMTVFYDYLPSAATDVPLPLDNMNTAQVTIITFQVLPIQLTPEMLQTTHTWTKP